jgi:glyoxylase-like metal-dependent hydrolase (beta-lactamase superfamily II)
MSPAANRPRIIDLQFLQQSGVIASYLLGNATQAALIEVGPTRTADTLLRAIAASGISTDAVRQLLVTHIHLDHAGAAGLLLERFPKAVLYVHERGVPHLIDPSKLIASATRIYGAAMDRLWGPMTPVPAHRVIPLHDGDRLEVAGQPFEVLYTPGHASHHVVFRALHDGSVFTGDAAGIKLPGCTVVHPPTPPPDLDLEAWDQTLDRLAALQAPVFYATHFGPSEHTDDHLLQLRTRLRAWESVVRHGLQQGQDADVIAQTLQQHAEAELRQEADEETIRRYAYASPYSMDVSGYERYLRKRAAPAPQSGNA